MELLVSMLACITAVSLTFLSHRRNQHILDGHLDALSCKMVEGCECDALEVLLWID